jgi:putative redox protein
MDGPEEFGGSNAATRPKDLLLVALAGCTGSDIVSILKKKRVALHDFHVDITAEVAEAHPKVFTSIHLDFFFRGAGIKAADVERAIDLSETKYCTVSAMLRPAVKLTHSYRIEDTAEPQA